MNDTVITVKDKRRKFLSDLKSLSYWCKRIIEVNLELEVLSVQLYEVAAIDYTKIPTTAPANKLGLLLREERLIDKRKEYVQYFEDCELIFRELSIEVQEFLMYSFIDHNRLKTQEQIASEYQISRTGLREQVEAELSTKL